MTINAIKAALNGAIDEYNTNLAIDGETEITGTQATTLTDTLAGVLETVNPNHDYPPTPR